MKTFLITLFFVFTATLGIAQSHEMGINGCNIKITAWDPEGFVEEKIEGLDLAYQHSQDQGRKLAFHYFSDSQFQFGSFNDVFEYTEWLLEHLDVPLKRYQSSINSAKDHANRSFMTKDSQGTPTYYYMYVDSLGDELVFSVISTSYKSFEEAAKDVDFFLKGLWWKK